MSNDTPEAPRDAAAAIDHPNPPTARTRAIHQGIAVNTQRVKSRTLALGAAVAAVVACAVGMVMILRG